MNRARYKVRLGQRAILLEAEHQLGTGDTCWFDIGALYPLEDSK